MSKQSILTHVARCITSRADIPLATQRELMNDINKAVKGTIVPPSDEWAALVKRIQYDRRGLASNKKKWTPDLYAMYEAYINLMDQVLVKVRIAKMKHHTLDAATAHAAQVNAQREARGEPLNGTCTGVWQSWVPPRVKEQFTQQLEAAYARSSRTKGNRLVPFAPPILRRRVLGRLSNMRTTIERWRTLATSVPGNKNGLGAKGGTPYRALYLAACRMAERRLDVIEAELGTPARPWWDAQIPVNWHALLEPEMRTRLHRAARYPDDVDLEGLRDFYEPPAETLTHAQHYFTTDIDTPEGEPDAYPNEALTLVSDADTTDPTTKENDDDKQ